MADKLTAEELARYKTLPEVLCVCGGQYDGKRLLATIDAQQAEIARLREALEAIEGAISLTRPSLFNQSLSVIARAALSATEDARWPG